MFKIEFTLAALKNLKKIDKHWQQKILERLRQLSGNIDRDSQVCRLKGGPQNRYRLRVADYRIVFDREDTLKILLILRIGHRKEIYRRFM